MSRWSALFLASRPLNLLIMAYTLAAMIYGVMWPGIQMYGLHSSPAFALSAVLILSILCLAAGGNLINDFFDVRVDEANGRLDNQVGKVMSYDFTLGAYRLLTLVGILLGALLAYIFKSPMLIFIHLFIAGSLWFYSKTWQRQYLMGNVVVGILTSMLPFIALTYASHGLFFLDSGYVSRGVHVDRPIDYTTVIAIYCLFALLSTVIRELIKDAQDMAGDRSAGYRTVAVVQGEAVTRRLCIGLILLLFLLTVVFCRYAYIEMSRSSLLAFALALLPVQVWILLVLLGHKKRPDYLRQASGLMKLLMFCGITTAWFFLLF